MTPKLPLSAINAMDAAAFTEALGGVFEYSPWVAEKAFAARPFGDVAALHRAMCQVVAEAAPEARLAFVRGHPELAGKAALAGDMTAHSLAEQSSAGLDRVRGAELDEFNRLNRAYRDRFGFPFIIAVRDHDRASILETFARRLDGGRDTELDEALRNVMRITELRLRDMVGAG